ncbi:hypothetical protein [Pseudooceanicola nanhaiensis]|nr:hypothetical protein [Pseudooceanicola nanhaiensis]MCA0920178.1 hypothetical protein [Pseudooceanicola nanhaiensis]
MIQIAPLPKPRKPRPALPPLVLRPSRGRTALSRYLRSPKPAKEPRT